MTSMTNNIMVSKIELYKYLYWKFVTMILYLYFTFHVYFLQAQSVFVALKLNSIHLIHFVAMNVKIACMTNINIMHDVIFNGG